MKMKCVVFTRTDGGVSIISPNPYIDIQQHIDKLISKGDIDPVDVPQIVDISDMPEDRTLRDAWTISGNKCVVDMAKGKEIVHAKRRAKRSAEFAPLDVEATIPAKANEAEAKRKKVRDKYAEIQGDIDAATTPEQLKAIIEGLL
jgi:hypothetical protein